MKSRSVAILMILVPLYVLGVLASSVGAPYWSDEVTTTEQQGTALTFVGDMMFDRYVREQAEVLGYEAILAETAPYLASSTVVFGNLEGPITEFDPVSDYRDQGPDHYRFTFATTVATTLAQANFSAVNIANNHITNFGVDGVEQTKEFLLQHNVGYVGSPNDPYTPWRTLANDTAVVVYSYDPWYAKDLQRVLGGIENENNEVFVVVYAHWGDEYETTPNKGQRELAKRFVDAGADFVVGSHPHVVQSKELYRQAWIYYSLGNFVFDQYFSPDVRCGAVVSAHLLSEGGYKVQEQFVELARDGTTRQSDCATEVSMLTDK